MQDQSQTDELLMTLVERALTLPEDQRQDYLRTECAGDSELFSQAWEYVRWEKRMGDFLLDPVFSLREPEPFFEPGQLVISRFRIVREVAQGGMGIVWEAFDEKLERKVAIKCAKAGFGKQLPPEVRNAREISHPNVCKIFEIHTASTPHGDVDFIVMEFLEGETLEERLRQVALSKKKSRAIAQQLCAGLTEAHRNKVIHGDLKSNNVILAAWPDGSVRAVITDFGLARRPETPGELLAGTPEYMAPELWQGAKPSVASDIYALGVILCELFSGAKPGELGPAASTLPLGKHHKQIPATQNRKWNRVLARCLDPDPTRRFSSAEEVSRALGPSRSRGWALGIAAAGALLLLGIASWWWTRRQPNAAQLTPVPLTAAPGSEQNPTFSPDGSQIAYAWDETGTGNNSHIYVKLIDSGRPVQLTAGPTSDVSPSWSPDGRSIAFVRMLDKGNAIYLIPPVGGTERKLTDGYFYGAGQWSPDGKFLAVADRKSPNEPSSLYRIAAENGEELRLTISPNAHTTDAYPVFSPDGRTLLFVRCGGTFTCALYLLDLSTGYQPRAEPRLLTKEAGPISGAAWTVDGKEAVYAFSSGGDSWSFHLMRIPVDAGAPPERLVYAGDNVFRPVIASHGDRLAYTQDSVDIDIWQVQLGNQPGNPPRSFASSTRIEYNPEYSPDGKRVAFSSSRSGQMEIWVSNAEGGDPIQLTNFAEHSGTPRWSPDGRWIAFDRHLKNGWHIFVMASDGGLVRQLTSDEYDEVIPSWSGDGKWIYYASNRTGRVEVWKTPAMGGKEIQVTRSGGWAAFESPDGHSLYYTKNLTNSEEPSGLWQLRLRDGEERLVLESVGSRSFAVKEDGIYYVQSPTADHDASVRFLDFATGKSREIASGTEPAVGFGGLTVSPDGKTILFAAATRTASNVMVVENFR